MFLKTEGKVWERIRSLKNKLNIGNRKVKSAKEMWPQLAKLLHALPETSDTKLIPPVSDLYAWPDVTKYMTSPSKLNVLDDKNGQYRIHLPYHMKLLQEYYNSNDKVNEEFEKVLAPQATQIAGPSLANMELPKYKAEPDLNKQVSAANTISGLRPILEGPIQAQPTNSLLQPTSQLLSAYLSGNLPQDRSMFKQPAQYFPQAPTGFTNNIPQSANNAAPVAEATPTSLSPEISYVNPSTGVSETRSNCPDPTNIDCEESPEDSFNQMQLEQKFASNSSPGKDGVEGVESSPISKESEANPWLSQKTSQDNLTLPPSSASAVASAPTSYGNDFPTVYNTPNSVQQTSSAWNPGQQAVSGDSQPNTYPTEPELFEQRSPDVLPNTYTPGAPSASSASLTPTQPAGQEPPVPIPAPLMTPPPPPPPPPPLPLSLSSLLPNMQPLPTSSPFTTPPSSPPAPSPPPPMQPQVPARPSTYTPSSSAYWVSPIPSQYARKGFWEEVQAPIQFQEMIPSQAQLPQVLPQNFNPSLTGTSSIWTSPEIVALAKQAAAAAARVNKPQVIYPGPSRPNVSGQQRHDTLQPSGYSRKQTTSNEQVNHVNAYPEPRNFGLDYLLAKKQAQIVRQKEEKIWADVPKHYSSYPRPPPLRSKNGTIIDMSKVKWPTRMKKVALKLSILPRNDGKYSMQINGPYEDSGRRINLPLSRHASRENLTQPEQQALAREQVKEEALSEISNQLPAKYIPPTNRDYERPPPIIAESLQELKRPLLRVKMPSADSQFIHLLGHLPHRPDQTSPSSDGSHEVPKLKTLSIKLPINVSLATVLKNIYEHMYEYYYHRRPNTTVTAADQAAARRVIQSLVMQNMQNMTNIVKDEGSSTANLLSSAMSPPGQVATDQTNLQKLRLIQSWARQPAGAVGEMQQAIRADYSGHELEDNSLRKLVNTIQAPERDSTALQLDRQFPVAWQGAYRSGTSLRGYPIASESQESRLKAQQQTYNRALWDRYKAFNSMLSEAKNIKTMHMDPATYNAYLHNMRMLWKSYAQLWPQSLEASRDSYLPGAKREANSQHVPNINMFAANRTLGVGNLHAPKYRTPSASLAQQRKLYYDLTSKQGVSMSDSLQHAAPLTEIGVYRTIQRAKPYLKETVPDIAQPKLQLNPGQEAIQNKAILQKLQMLRQAQGRMNDQTPDNTDLNRMRGEYEALLRKEQAFNANLEAKKLLQIQNQQRILPDLAQTHHHLPMIFNKAIPQQHVYGSSGYPKPSIAYRYPSSMLMNKQSMPVIAQPSHRRQPPSAHYDVSKTRTGNGILRTFMGSQKAVIQGPLYAKITKEIKGPSFMVELEHTGRGNSNHQVYSPGGSAFGNPAKASIQSTQHEKSPGDSHDELNYFLINTAGVANNKPMIIESLQDYERHQAEKDFNKSSQKERSAVHISAPPTQLQPTNPAADEDRSGQAMGTVGRDALNHPLSQADWSVSGFQKFPATAREITRIPEETRPVFANQVVDTVSRIPDSSPKLEMSRLMSPQFRIDESARTGNTNQFAATQNYPTWNQMPYGSPIPLSSDARLVNAQTPILSTYSQNSLRHGSAYTYEEELASLEKNHQKNFIQQQQPAIQALRGNTLNSASKGLTDGYWDKRKIVPGDKDAVEDIISKSFIPHASFIPMKPMASHRKHHLATRLTLMKRGLPEKAAIVSARSRKSTTFKLTGKEPKLSNARKGKTPAERKRRMRNRKRSSIGIAGQNNFELKHAASDSHLISRQANHDKKTNNTKLSPGKLIRTKSRNVANSLDRSAAWFPGNKAAVPANVTSNSSQTSSEVDFYEKDPESDRFTLPTSKLIVNIDDDSMAPSAPNALSLANTSQLRTPTTSSVPLPDLYEVSSRYYSGIADRQETFTKSMYDKKVRRELRESKQLEAMSWPFTWNENPWR